jgi:mono/diheme cytochrome c family protein
MGVFGLNPLRADPAQDYVLYCMGCHGEQGQGVPGRVPALAQTLDPLLRTARGREYLQRVPGAANSALPDARLAAVLNWLTAEFAPSARQSGVPAFSAAEVGRLRRQPLASVSITRRGLLGGGPR